MPTFSMAARVRRWRSSNSDISKSSVGMDGPFLLGVRVGWGAVGGGEGFGDGGEDVVVGGAGEEVYVDGLKGLGVDAGTEAEFEGEPGGGLGVFGFGDEYEVVSAEDHVAGEEGGAGYVDLLGDVVNEVRVVY